MNTTLLLFVSRSDFLDELFDSLEQLQCQLEQTAFLCIVNGDNNLFVDVRNRVEESKYIERLTLQIKPKNKVRQFDIAGRRHRISEIHNFAKEHINTKYVFGVEDDTIVPPYALNMLGENMTNDVGMIEGVEMGRWGIPYIGAWKADDIHQPTTITSLPMNEGLTEIDAGGFYCFLTRAEYYKQHDFKPFDNNGLGPDIDYSLSLRRKGLKNYANFDVKCVHKALDRDIRFGVTLPRQIKMYKKGNQWRQNILPV